ncbi:Fur family transcriptional regulator [Acidithiobacillus montserratensis]|uniref:Fur family transcriptional regulator n=1 Tax=Acidithiobacillus montserratensis TaxID=2729135 RepID=A0ACD5HJS1_9PROT|nr:Fur family transcriptional regulator [Acidithiobacillus montserratensis]MBN2680594.1 transcriptional repressor [Acidithiobacillaceae bacterium]MBU2749322.1 transcriptional repressor [Acidithiobacillus montserratensis]
MNNHVHDTPLKHSDAEVTRLLREAGQRVTRLRVAVYKALLEAEQPLSHPEVQQRLENSMESPVDRVSLYRNLEWLVDIGLAHRITADDRIWRFSARRQEHSEQHPHFHCVSCGQVFCLPDSQLAAPKLPKDYSVIEMELVVNGLCAHCGRKK